jgi:phosphomannomutase
MTSLRITIGGARGIVGESLTPALLVRYSHAFGTYVSGGKVLISRDTRPSGEMVRRCVLAGLQAAGCEVVDLGICPTPALQYAVRHSDAAGGMAITAGHNDIGWNALKTVRHDGIFLNRAQAEELLDIYHQGEYRKAGWDQLYPAREDDDAGNRHLEAIAGQVDVAAIRQRKMMIAVDCVNGACSRYAPLLLGQLGCRFVEMNVDPELPFPHKPDPSAQNLGQLRALVQASGADAGFCFDADGDRLGIVCENGHMPGEEMTICLAAEMILSRGDAGPVVTNLCTTQALDDIARAHDNRPVIHTGIGQAYISEAALNNGACVGGEGSGGCVFPGLNYCNDSLTTMAHVLELIARRGPLSKIVKSLPQYSMVKATVPCPTQFAFSALEALRMQGEPEWADPALTDLSDGIRYQGDHRWAYVRVSATEPLIRVIAEAPEPEEAKELTDQLLGTIRQII